MTTNTNGTEHSHALNALGDALESAADSVSQARADATESAKLAARKVQIGVSTSAYYAAYGVAYGVVFSGVFLKELLPINNPVRRGFEDGAAAAIDAANSRLLLEENSTVEDAVLDGDKSV